MWCNTSFDKDEIKSKAYVSQSATIISMCKDSTRFVARMQNDSVIEIYSPYFKYVVGEHIPHINKLKPGASLTGAAYFDRYSDNQVIEMCGNPQLQKRRSIKTDLLHNLERITGIKGY